MSPGHRLRQLTALAHFSDAQLDTLARASQVVTAPEGQVVVARGDVTPRVYGLTEGSMTVRQRTVDGECVLARSRPGELFGEVGFVDRQPASADLVASSDCELVLFDDVRLEELCGADRRFDQALRWAMWNSMSRKLRLTIRMLSHHFAGQQADSGHTSVREPRPGRPLELSALSRRDFLLRQHLEHMESNLLASLSRGRRFTAGQTIFRESQAGETLYFIVDGEVRISKNIPGTGEEALAILGPGEVFGEMSLVDRRPRTADALAHESEVDLLAVPGPVVARLLDVEKMSSAPLLGLFCRTIARRLRALDDKITGLYMLSGGGSTVIGGARRGYAAH